MVSKRIRLGISRDDIIVDGEGHRQHESGYDSRQNLRDNDGEQCPRGRGAEVERRLVQIVVHLFELGDDGQDDEGGTQHHLPADQGINVDLSIFRNAISKANEIAVTISALMMGMRLTPESAPATFFLE